MIGTVTLNPAVDCRYVVPALECGAVVRALQVERSAGGKGLNVSRVIRQLGEPVVATGFLGGANGRFIREQLQICGIEDRFLGIAAETRSCLAILSPEGAQTEILEAGPTITTTEWQAWRPLYQQLLQDCTYICASGSLPGGVPPTAYRELIAAAKQQGRLFMLDTSGEGLREAIAARPFMIKPNLAELEQMAGRTLMQQTELLEVMEYLEAQGVTCIIVSLGKSGALVGWGGRKYKVTIPRIKAVNPVGSGDSLVAGFAVGLQRGYSERQTLAFACACGSANALEYGTGIVDAAVVKALLADISVVDV